MKSVKDKITWYDEVANHIQENILDFYGKFYKEELQPIGNAYRLQPCPKCGHNDCCTVGESVHCFSCDWKGTNINTFIDQCIENEGISKFAAIKKLEDWSQIAYPKGRTKEDVDRAEKQERIQSIKLEAVKFYANNLMNNKSKYSISVDEITRSYTPLEYQLTVRKHEIKTLQVFKIGFVSNYFDLYNDLLSKGYEKEEIKAAKIWFVEGMFVYPYFDPTTKEVIRFNAKNPFNAESKNPKTGKIEVLKGMSSGPKVFGFAPGFSFNKDVVVLEGENDGMTVFENGYTNICWSGGTIRQTSDNDEDNPISQLDKTDQLFILERCNKAIYTCTDNDEKGEEYVTEINNKFPHKEVFRITFGKTFNDIDDFYKKGNNNIPFEDLMKRAERLETDKFKISSGENNTWSIEDRHRKVIFTITNKDKNDKIVGKIDFFVDGILKDREEEKALTQCRTNKRPLNFYLDDAIQVYFNSDLDKKSFEELVSIYNFCSNKTKIIRLIAKQIYLAEKNEDNVLHEQYIDKIKRAFNNDIVDSILKEMNDLTNLDAVENFHDIPKMRISEYFNLSKNDAYFYFTMVKPDGDVVRKLPYLLKNNKKLIRLDLLKRKDPQCLLLIDNKYELPQEVSEAVLDLRECSLNQIWVEKYVSGQIGQDELNPYELVKEVETYIRKFFYHPNETVYKVLALWIYGTYFYELFNEYPYLLLNGEKGSGKSRLNSVIYMFSLNAKLAANISESALYRTIGFEGGVFIMDEMENLTSKSANANTVMGPILKSGYAKEGGNVYRTDIKSEQNNTENFNVYCPKVISNIFGVEDVLEDRCIRIETKSVDVSKVALEDPKLYITEKMNVVREITSKCCFSALEDFQKVAKIYYDTKFITSNARLTQLLSPIFAIALFADMNKGKSSSLSLEEISEIELEDYAGEYTSALKYFFETVISVTKREIESNTAEGIIKESVRTIALELLGLTDNKDYINPDNHKFTDKILYDVYEGWFEVTMIHFKCFIEENLPGEAVYSRTLNKWIKSSFGNVEINRKIVNIGYSDSLMKDFNGNAKPRVNNYRFRFEDFVDESYIKKKPSNIKQPTTNRSRQDELF